MSACTTGRGVSARPVRRAWVAVAAALALLTAVLAAGCSGGAAGSARPAEPSTLAGYYAQRLDWQPCDNGFECARLLVPFDYARPAGSGPAAMEKLQALIVRALSLIHI